MHLLGIINNVWFVPNGVLHSFSIWKLPPTCFISLNFSTAVKEKSSGVIDTSGELHVLEDALGPK